MNKPSEADIELMCICTYENINRNHPDSIEDFERFRERYMREEWWKSYV